LQWNPFEDPQISKALKKETLNHSAKKQREKDMMKLKLLDQITKSFSSGNLSAHSSTNLSFNDKKL